MLCLKNIISFICVIGALLGCGGFYSSLAMEDVTTGEERPSRKGSPGFPAADDMGAERDNPTVLPLSLSGDAGTTTVLVDDMTRLINAIFLQQNRSRVPDDFFFIPIPVGGNTAVAATESAILDEVSTQGEERAGELSVTYKLTSVRRADGQEMPFPAQEVMRNIGTTFLDKLREKSRYLAWPTISDSLEESSLAPASSVTSTHLFYIADRDRRNSLEEYLREGFCLVRKHTITFKRKPQQSDNEILFSAETYFPPIEAKITGIYFMKILGAHKISVWFLIQSSLFLDLEPQFVCASETALEAEDLVGLPNWVHWDLTKSPSYQGAKYPPNASTYKYRGDWWRDWITGAPDYVALNYSLLAFLGHFRESLLLHGKETDSTSQGALIGFKPEEEGFYEVLSASPLRGGNYIYVQPDGRLHATQMSNQAWRKEKGTAFLSITACQAGPTVFTPLNLIVPPELRPGFYEVISGSSAEESMQLHSIMDDSNVTLQREAPTLPYGFEVQKIGDANGSLAQVLETAQQPYVLKLIIEDLSIPVALLPEAIGQWVHLRHLSLRNCFDKESLPIDAARPFFNALKGLKNLEKFDFSGNKVDMETFAALAHTLLGNRSKSLKHISVSLPKKPSAVTTAIKRNQISNWTVRQVEPFMYMPFLETLEVFGVRRKQEGCTATQAHLESMRRGIETNSKGEMTFSPLTITLYPSSEVPEEEWEIVD